jgi:hypothetical protein
LDCAGVATYRKLYPSTGTPAKSKSSTSRYASCRCAAIDCEEVDVVVLKMRRYEKLWWSCEILATICSANQGSA